ncbi:MAG: GNAT family N-acetyltransferase [Mesorhizobium sp.]|nr:GNAT family N-acetyltransferase [Mesorhizobium sp.]MBL8577911.1 GNAT family N-acetyltransferase [Mesorhizobium sp.]
MSLTISPMRENDIATVAALRMEAFFAGTDRTYQEDYTGLHRLLLDDSTGQALVAHVDGNVAGTVLFVPEELDAIHDLTPWLAGLVVAETHRGKGIGSALVSAVERHAEASGVETLYLYSWHARRFYAARGWTEMQAFMQDGEPMALMSRHLRYIRPAT